MLSTAHPTLLMTRSLPLLRRPIIGALVIAALALLVRFAYLSQARQAPDFDILFSDQNTYDTWAQQIAAGDWISRTQGVFFQSPLYPYFLAVFYTLFGRELLWLRMLQLVMGSAACVMLYTATRRLLGPTAGLIAGAFLALYPSAILFDAQLDKTVLDTFLLALLIWLMSRLTPARDKLDATPAPGARSWLWIGLALGLWTLNRENALLLIPILCIWTWLAFRQISARQRAIRLAVFLLGTFGVLSGSLLHNLFVGAELHLTTAQLGHNLWLGNGEGADGVYHTLRESRADPLFERHDAASNADGAMGRTLSPGEVSNYFVRRTLREIADDPLRWIKLAVRKSLLVWNRAEIADSADLDYFVAWSSLLRRLDAILNFPTLFALFSFGIALTWRDRRRLVVLYMMLIAFALATAAFYVFARYRYPLVLMMIPSAAGGVASLAPAIRARQWRSITLGALLAVVALTISLPAAVLPERVRGVDYYNRAVAFANRGATADAIASYRRALRANPNSAQAHNNLGLLLADQRDLSAALAQLDQSVQLASDRADFLNNRATVLIQMNRLDQAQADLAQAVRLNPEFVSGWFNLGVLAALRGQPDLAIQALTEVVHRQANYHDAQFRLGQALAAVHRDRDAVEHLRLALQFDPNALPAVDALALLLATSQLPDVKNPLEAQRIAETANRITQGQSPKLLDTLSLTYAAQDRWDEAIQIANRARTLAELSGSSGLVQQIDARLKAWQQRIPKP